MNRNTRLGSVSRGVILLATFVGVVLPSLASSEGSIPTAGERHEYEQALEMTTAALSKANAELTRADAAEKGWAEALTAAEKAEREATDKKDEVAQKTRQEAIVRATTGHTAALAWRNASAALVKDSTTQADLAARYNLTGETLSKLGTDDKRRQDFEMARNAFRSGRAEAEPVVLDKKKNLDTARTGYDDLAEVKRGLEAKKKSESAVEALEQRLTKAKAAHPRSPAYIVAIEDAIVAGNAWVVDATAAADNPWDAAKFATAESNEKIESEKVATADEAERNAGKYKEPGVKTRHFLLTTGVTSLAPYRIKETTDATAFDGTDVNPAGNPKIFYLEDSSDVDVLGFIDFRFRKNLAWDRAAARPENRHTGQGWSLACDGSDKGEARRLLGLLPAKGKTTVPFMTHKCWLPSNMDVRTGFVFGKKGTVNGSALAGAGDVNVGLSFGWPLLNRDWDTATVTDAFSLEVTTDVVTERGVQDVHDRYTVGPAYSIGFLSRPFSFPGNDVDKTFERVWEFSIRGGWAWIETPNKYPNSEDICVPDCTAGSRVVRIRNRSKPLFKTNKTFAVEVGAQMPIGQAAFLTLSSGIFGGDPNPWFLRLGITVPIDGVLGIFSEYAL